MKKIFSPHIADKHFKISLAVIFTGFFLPAVVGIMCSLSETDNPFFYQILICNVKTAVIFTLPVSIVIMACALRMHEYIAALHNVSVDRSVVSMYDVTINRNKGRSLVWRIISRNFLIKKVFLASTADLLYRPLLKKK